MAAELNNETRSPSQNRSPMISSLASKWCHSNTVMAIRKATVGDNHCYIFCKGANCKYEDPTFWRPDQMVLNGSFSHWVTDDVMAMSRPTTLLIREYDFIGQLAVHGIKSVFCVQKPGEHSHCGPKLEPSGFSYNPQELMDAGLYFYNFGWDDFGVPSMPMLLDLVRVVDFAVSRGKVAIHCHAGLGRTGVLIACYLVYSRRWESKKCIKHVRARRPDALQTVKQVELVLEYKLYMDNLWKVFPLCDEHRFSLDEFMSNQGELLHGDDWKKHKHVSKIISHLCGILLKDCEKISDISRKRQLKVIHTDSNEFLSQTLHFSKKELSVTEAEINNTANWEFLTSLDGDLVWGLILDWMFNLKSPCLPQFEIISIKNIVAEKNHPWKGVKNENVLNLVEYISHFLSQITDTLEREMMAAEISRVLIKVHETSSLPMKTSTPTNSRKIPFLFSRSSNPSAASPSTVLDTEHFSEEENIKIVTEAFNSCFGSFE